MTKLMATKPSEIRQTKDFLDGCGCDTVGRVVSSSSLGLRFEARSWNVSMNGCIEITKKMLEIIPNKKTDATLV